MFKRVLVVLFVISFSYLNASIKIDGFFMAKESCQAYESIKKETNRDNSKLRVDKIYNVVGKNRKNATHYKIVFDEAKPKQRWIKKECGKFFVDRKKVDTKKRKFKKEYLLAVSWQSAFCENAPYKLECKTQKSSSFNVKNFSLHGLWPQPRENVYCGVSSVDKKFDKSGKWHKLKKLDLKTKTKEELEVIMAGVASNLQRHEWIKHGTCYSETEEEYYRESIELIEQLNNSKLQDYFESKIGKKVKSKDIRAEFNKVFGSKSGDRVEIKCRKDKSSNRNLITEIWINLNGEITESSKISNLIKNAKPRRVGCKSGVIDAYGLQ